MRLSNRIIGIAGRVNEARVGIAGRVNEAVTGTCARSGRCVDYIAKGICIDKKCREGYGIEEGVPRCYKPRNPAEQKTQES